jgi:hypothetical protein
MRRELETDEKGNTNGCAGNCKLGILFPAVQAQSKVTKDLIIFLLFNLINHF